MASSSAACVFGEARLISSTSSRCANTGPGRNSNSFVLWLKTFTPVTSEGSRSGVNWRREKEQSIERASAFASIVFPTPGKSSMIRWPSATRQRTASRSVSSVACTTCARLSTIFWTDSAASLSTRSLPPAPSIYPPQAGRHLVEDRRGDPFLRCFLDAPLARTRNEDDLVVGGIEADVIAAHIVEDDQVDSLVAELLPRALEPALSAIGCEAHEQLAVRAPSAELPQDVGRRLEGDRPRPVVLRALLLLGLGRAVVGDGSGHHDHVGVAAGERLPGDVCGGRGLHHVHSYGNGNREVRGDERDVSAAPARLRCDGRAHPARRPVAEKADGVERLAGSPGRDEDA